MAFPCIGILGGTGVYDIEGLTDTHWKKLILLMAILRINFFFGKLNGN
jgi:hypothetical protein